MQFENIVDVLQKSTSVTEEKLINLIYPFTTTAKMATQNLAEVMLKKLQDKQVQARGYTTEQIRGKKKNFTIIQGNPPDNILGSPVYLLFSIDKNDDPLKLIVGVWSMDTGNILFSASIGNNELKLILDKIETSQVYAKSIGIGLIIIFDKVETGKVVTGKAEFEVPESSQVEFSVPSQVNLPENDTPNVQRGITKGLESLNQANFAPPV